MFEILSIMHDERAYQQFLSDYIINDSYPCVTLAFNPDVWMVLRTQVSVADED